MQKLFISVLIYDNDDDDDNDNLCVYIHLPDNLYSFSIEKHQRENTEPNNLFKEYNLHNTLKEI